MVVFKITMYLTIESTSDSVKLYLLKIVKTMIILKKIFFFGCTGSSLMLTGFL